MSGDIPIPRATYRLQLNRDFRFADAAALAGYLERLGISHAYLSPILKARAGSTHGYDTIDHAVLNPELGSLDDFRAMAAQFRRHGIGLIVDFVPNHMGVGGSDNTYWLDVLELGEASRYAGWFDIDWHPAEPSLAGKLLAPVLGKSYGEALANHDLALRFDAGTGELAVWAHKHHKLPLAPASYADVFAAPTLPDTSKPGLEAAARDPDLLRRIEAAVAALNADPAALDALIGRQHWRVAESRVADDIINYRRFFIVSDLAAIRIERREVFDHAHRLIFSLIAEGLIDGLRIDHVDGLWDPKAYCLALRRASPRPIYIVVEKILAADETLRTDWNIEGTTGYEFSALVAPLLTDPAAEAPLTRFYRELTGETATPAALERAGKQRIMDHELAAELESLSYALADLARAERSTRDFTRAALRRGLRAILAEMPVYRTYVDDAGATGAETALIAKAAAAALARDPGLGADLLQFLRRVLTVELDGPLRAPALAVARRIQQFSGPVMAKGLEDTALYRYNRLIALNDVGERPEPFSLDVMAFHAANQRRLAQHPYSMLTSSSHDTKRGEDARARIAAISAHAADWIAAVPRWLDLLRGQGAPEIDRNAAYLAFQMLVGSWPFAPPAPEALAALGERLRPALIKSLREARVHTTWGTPDAAYEAAASRFVDVMLTPGRNAFLADFASFAAGLALDGARNGLIATVLKLTGPGVPDIYQGAERWEQSMVDPDNRRPVDFAAGALQDDDGRGVGAATPADWQTGRIKQALIARLLELRRQHPGLFAAGSYLPIIPTAPGAGRVLAFERQFRGAALLVAAPLPPWGGVAAGFVAGLAPEALSARWRDVLNGDVGVDPAQAAATLDRGLPLVLFRDDGT